MYSMLFNNIHCRWEWLQLKLLWLTCLGRFILPVIHEKGTLVIFHINITKHFHAFMSYYASESRFLLVMLCFPSKMRSFMWPLREWELCDNFQNINWVWLYLSAPTAITNCHRLYGLNNRNSFIEGYTLKRNLSSS